MVYEMHLRDGIEQGWLARVRAWRVEMGPTLAEMSDSYPDEVRAVEDLCAARMPQPEEAGADE